MSDELSNCVGYLLGVDAIEGLAGFEFFSRADCLPGDISGDKFIDGGVFLAGRSSSGRLDASEVVIFGGGRGAEDIPSESGVLSEESDEWRTSYWPVTLKTPPGSSTTLPLLYTVQSPEVNITNIKRGIAVKYYQKGPMT